MEGYHTGLPQDIITAPHGKDQDEEEAEHEKRIYSSMFDQDDGSEVIFERKGPPGLTQYVCARDAQRAWG